MKDKTPSLALLSLIAACSNASSSVPPNSSDASTEMPQPAPPQAPKCSPASVSEIEVTTRDLLGYPPYSADGCRIAYVSGAGELRLRDLQFGTDTLVAPASESPRRPTLTEDLLAWEATVEGRTRIRIKTGETIEESPATLASATEPKAYGTAVVFTAWPSGPIDSDVWLFEDGASIAVASGPGEQRFADLSATWVAFADFSEDPDGRYDENEKDVSDIVLVHRTTGEVVRRPQPGKQSFPMLTGGDLVAYLDWNAVHPEPKFEAFKLRVGDRRAAPAEDRTVVEITRQGPPARPAGRGGVLEWVADTDQGPRLFRAPADGTQPPAPIADVDVAVASPSITNAMTIVAGSLPTAKTTAPLRAIAR